MKKDEINKALWEYYRVATEESRVVGTQLISWKGSHHRIPFHFKYGWFTPSYTTNAIERFRSSYTLKDTKLWEASQR